MEALSVTNFMSWLELHQEWLAVTIGLIAFFESLVVVGIALPGVVMLFTAATIAGSGGFAIENMLFAGFVGAVCGDGVSYLVGYFWHDRVRGWWPFRSHPDWLDKGEQFFVKHGSASIIFGRFVGPVRPVIPVVAGIMGMSPGRFFLVNILSALAWSPAYLMPGYLAGASVNMGHIFSTDLLYLLGAAAALAFVLSFLVLRCQPWLENKNSKLLIVFTLALMALVVCVGSQPVKLVNEQVLHGVMGLHTVIATKVMSVYTAVGTKPFFLTVIALATFWLWRDSGLRKSMGFLGLAAVMMLLVAGLKGSTEVLRPGTATSQSFSFPSRHVAISGFLFLWLGHYFSQGGLARYRLWGWTVALTLTFWMAVTRLYLGQHWFSDVTGGFLICMLGLLGWLQIHRYTGELQPSRRTYVYRVVQLVVVYTAAVLVKLNMA